MQQLLCGWHTFVKENQIFTGGDEIVYLKSKGVLFSFKKHFLASEK